MGEPYINLKKDAPLKSEENNPLKGNTWDFNTPEVAKNFDAHIAGQLPWYPSALHIVKHLGRHYLTEGSTFYDVGCSTGNCSSALEYEIVSRNVKAISLDKAEEMVKVWKGVGEVQCTDALEYDFSAKPFSFATVFLTLMFLRPDYQAALLNNLAKGMSPGGAIFVVDKVSFSGYLATVMHRLTIAGKISSGISAQDIIDKELSLSGVQRPIETAIFPPSLKAASVFQYGEFAGWVLTK